MCIPDPDESKIVRNITQSIGFLEVEDRLSQVLRIQDEVEKLWKSLEEKDAKVTSLKEKMAKAEKENEEAIKMSNADMTRIKEHDKLIKELRTSLEAAKENITSKDK
jgi:predicted RNase H-like nuclease (RuvC/YqgF family)